MPKCIQRAADAPLFALGSDSAQRLEMALCLLACGFALLPLRGEKPAFGLLRKVNGRPKWEALAKNKATAEDVRAWFARDRTINIGVITGEAWGGLVVID